MGANKRAPLAWWELRFERMIDEHTAIYQIMTVQYELTPDGEIAVLLPDSNPPDPKRLWRVLLEGVLEGTMLWVPQSKYQQSDSRDTTKSLHNSSTTPTIAKAENFLPPSSARNLLLAREAPFFKEQSP